jgi:hypothetical protein
MAISYSGEYNEVNDGQYLSSNITVGTTEIEAKVGASRLVGRQRLRIYNDSSVTIYFGPSGVSTTSGEPLLKKQWIELEFGDIGVFVIAGSAGNNVIIQEVS